MPDDKQLPAPEQPAKTAESSPTVDDPQKVVDQVLGGEAKPTPPLTPPPTEPVMEPKKEEPRQPQEKVPEELLGEAVPRVEVGRHDKPLAFSGAKPVAPIKPTMPEGLKPVETPKNKKGGKKGLLMAAIVGFAVLGVGLVGAIGYELLTGKPGLIAWIDSGLSGTANRDTGPGRVNRRAERDQPVTDPNHELERLINTGDVQQQQAVDSYRDRNPDDTTIRSNIEIAQANRTVELGQKCASDGPAGRVWECASGQGECTAAGECKFVKSLGMQGDKCGGNLDCVNGYVCDMKSGSPTLGQCIANPNLVVCGRDKDPTAPICCTSTTRCEGQIVCEKPARKECKTTLDNGKEVWCLMEANSGYCGGGGTRETTVKPSPSPSGQGGGGSLACTSLTKDKADSTIKIGTKVTFSCAGSVTPSGATNLTYTFRIRKDSGGWQSLSASGDKASYTVAAVGKYDVQCKACGTISGASVCDPNWGSAQ